MASQSAPKPVVGQEKPAVTRLIRILMYAVLIGYALISILPLWVMVSTSLMTLGEANAGRFLPSRVVIDQCIIFTTDTVLDDETGEAVSRTHFTIFISEETAEGLQGINPSVNRTLERNVHFRIPFPVNYCAAWEDAKLGTYMWNTVRIVTITILGLLLFSVPAAYAFARMDFPGRNLLFAAMLATLMIPEMVQNLPNFLIITELGDWMGSEGLGLCGELKNCWYNNWPALTIPFMATPFSIFLMRQQFATIPEDLWDAARMDGSGHFRFMLQIVIPLSRSVLLVVILLTFLAGWNALAWPILVTTGDTWRPISYGLQTFLREEGNFANLQMAGATIAALPVLLLYAFVQRYFVEGLSTSGLKG